MFSYPKQGHFKLLLCHNKIGSKPYSFPEMMNGLFHLFFLKQRIPKIVMRFGEVKVEFNSHLVMRNCVLILPPKTGREKASDSKCNLVKIENLYRNHSQGL